MSEKRITLAANEAHAFETAPPPLEDARRWRSAHEGILATGWPAIFMTQQVYLDVNAHAHSDVRREVGGLLVGQVRQTPEDDLYVVVEAHLPARHVNHGPVHLTFTSETLLDALARLEETFPESEIVGWYHSHPGMSLFLSSMDTWLHTHFFPKAWHVALVLEPQTNQAGFFRYENGERDALHSHRYVGFYELLDGETDSIVTWNNLIAEKEDKLAQANEAREDYLS